jgi:hypothetical protein
LDLLRLKLNKKEEYDELNEEMMMLLLLSMRSEYEDG